MTGTVSGVALAPGVSKNGRLYTKANITKAYERLHARVSDPKGSPVVMRTHHAAGDDSTRIVAQINKVSLDPNGVLSYVANYADTEHAQTIRKLSQPGESGKPALAHVSIYGWWTAEPSTVTLEDGTTAETCDDLEIDAIDFTASPGVVAASARGESARRNAITESHDAEITVTETATVELGEADPKPVTPGASGYADPGYQKDGKKRYPTDTAAHVRAAWSFINVTANQSPYTAAQVKRIKSRIKSAALKVGVKIADSWMYSADPVTETAEYYGAGDIAGAYPDGQPASFCFGATNGPISVNISSYCIDPADLEVIVAKACAAITLALKDFDPDMDGDIDVPPDSDDESLPPRVLPDAGDMESVTPTDTADSAGTEEAATSAADPSQEMEAVVSDATESTIAAVEVAQPVIDYTKLAEALAPAMLAATTQAEEARVAAAAEEAAKTETATAQAAQLREVMKEAAREILIEGNVAASRKGHGLTEQTQAEPTGAELFEKRGELFIAAMRENTRLGLSGKE